MVFTFSSAERQLVDPDVEGIIPALDNSSNGGEQVRAVYDLSGRKLSSHQESVKKGIYILKTTDAAGNQQAKKVIIP